MIWLMLALAGGVGAGLRYLVDTAVNARRHTGLPWGSFVVNVLGSFVLGLLGGAWLDGAPAWRTVLGTGFCGGFTTFSTAMLESARLVHEGRVRAGLGLVVAMALACVVAAGLGFGITLLVQL